MVPSDSRALGQKVPDSEVGLDWSIEISSSRISIYFPLLEISYVTRGLGCDRKSAVRGVEVVGSDDRSACNDVGGAEELRLRT